MAFMPIFIVSVVVLIIRTVDVYNSSGLWHTILIFAFVFLICGWIFYFVSKIEDDTPVEVDE